MLPYRHTQTSAIVVVIFAAAIAVLVVQNALAGFVPASLVVLAIMVGALLVFRQLTVEVDRQSVRLRFGLGLFRKRFPLAAVRGAKAVRNRWYYGLGIRRLWHGWLYCVSGLDAVELELEDGSRPRIGTDEPRRLEAAIREALGAARR